METRANPVPFILAGALVLMAVLVGLRSCTETEPKRAHSAMKTVPEAPPADADTPADTIRTLRAGVADMTHKFTAMSEENRRLLEQNKTLEREVRALRTQDSARAAADTRAQSALQGLSQRIEELSGGLRSVQAKPPSLRGVGLTANPEALVWIEPVGPPASFPARPGGDAPKPGQPAPEKQSPPPKPVYTIAENMALAGSIAFTALVGRIPIRGHIQDPFPFYVLVGADNLAANGLELPEVAGVIFRGTALGDWNLSCVRGRLVSATFIFHNGTIRTVRGTEQEPLGELRRALCLGQAHHRCRVLSLATRARLRGGCRRGCGGRRAIHQHPLRPDRRRHHHGHRRRREIHSRAHGPRERPGHRGLAGRSVRGFV